MTASDERNAAPCLPCALCGGQADRLLLWGSDNMGFGEGSFAVVRCARCGLRQTYPHMSMAQLAPFYPPSYYGEVPAVVKHSAPARVHALGRRLHRQLLAGRGTSRLALRCRPKDLDVALPMAREPGLLLDVGAGWGHFAAACLGVGWRVEVADIGESIDRVAARLGIAAHRGTIEEIAERVPPSYRMISFNHVLEHIDDPLSTLRAARRLLAPGGIVRVRIPLWRGAFVRIFGDCWASLDLPRHRVHFEPADLRRFAGRAGFSQVLFVPELGTRVLNTSMRWWGHRRGMSERWAETFRIGNRWIRLAALPGAWLMAAANRPFEGIFYLLPDGEGR